MVEDCISGLRFSRKLLRWAEIERPDFVNWCEGQGIPLPEFWFPPGWKVTYEWPEERTGAADKGTPISEPEASKGRQRVYQRRCTACQEIASNLWKEDPSITISAMVEHEAIQRLGGGRFNAPEVVRRWIAEVAPQEVKARRGRPRKNPTPEE